MNMRATFLGAACALLLCAAGCGKAAPAPETKPRLSDPPGRPEPEAAPMVSLLTVEVPAPAVVESVPPPAAEPTPEPAEETTATVDPGLSAENIAQVNVGMTYEEVVEYFGFPGLTVSSNGADKFIVQWTDDLGVNFWGKFEDDRLVRKTAANLEDADPASSEALTHELYNSVSEGMSFEDVLAKISIPATPLSDNDDTVIYRWQDDKGSSFTARFEGNRLARKSGLTIIPLEEATEDVDVADLPEDEEAVDTAEVSEGEVFEGEEPVEETPPRRMRLNDRRGDDVVQLAEEVVESVAGDAVTSIVAPSRVRVIGAGRREREETSGPRRDYLEKVSLPDYTYTLRTGRYEVRIHNDSEARVAVGLRAEKRGRDLTIEPHSRKSLFVDRGGYTLHYIFNDDPYTSYRSELINVGGTFVSDIEIAIFNEQYDIRKLIHGRPGN